MPLQAIQTVMDAERDAQAYKTEQHAKAKKLLDETSAAGRELLAKTERECRSAGAERLQKAESAAAKAAAAVMAENEALCESLRTSARSKLPTAEKLILERVVNS